MSEKKFFDEVEIMLLIFAISFLLIALHKLGLMILHLYQ